MYHKFLSKVVESVYKSTIYNLLCWSHESLLYLLRKEWKQLVWWYAWYVPQRSPESKWNLHICREKKRWRSLVQDHHNSVHVCMWAVQSWGLMYLTRGYSSAWKNRLSWPDGEWDEVTFLPFVHKISRWLVMTLSLVSEVNGDASWAGRRQNPISPNLSSFAQDLFI